MSKATITYNRYAEVPTHRKQWFFWLMFFTLSPVAIAVLLTEKFITRKKTN